jgi:NADH-quinone oxidoreductase subunit L
MSDEQDIRKMGGIWRKIPITYAMMWIGSLALAGIPTSPATTRRTSCSRPPIAANSGVGMYAFVLRPGAAFLTAFYSWRLIILTFHGAPRADKDTMDHVHESPAVMIVPLLVLAAGAVVDRRGVLPLLRRLRLGQFWNGSIVNAPHNDIMHAAHTCRPGCRCAPPWSGLSGIALAYLLYMLVPPASRQARGALRRLYRFLLNKWYFDELYDRDLRPPDPRAGARAVADGRCAHHRRHAQRCRRSRPTWRAGRCASRPAASRTTPSS